MPCQSVRAGFFSEMFFLSLFSRVFFLRLFLTEFTVNGYNESVAKLPETATKFGQLIGKPVEIFLDWNFAEHPGFLSRSAKDQAEIIKRAWYDHVPKCLIATRPEG
jgi:hypothetical protein